MGLRSGMWDLESCNRWGSCLFCSCCYCVKEAQLSSDTDKASLPFLTSVLNLCARAICFNSILHLSSLRCETFIYYICVVCFSQIRKKLSRFTLTGLPWIICVADSVCPGEWDWSGFSSCVGDRGAYLERGGWGSGECVADASHLCQTGPGNFDSCILYMLFTYVKLDQVTLMSVFCTCCSLMSNWTR